MRNVNKLAFYCEKFAQLTKDSSAFKGLKATLMQKYSISNKMWDYWVELNNILDLDPKYFIYPGEVVEYGDPRIVFGFLLPNRSAAILTTEQKIDKKFINPDEQELFFEESSSKILLPYKNIPKLYLHLGTLKFNQYKKQHSSTEEDNEEDSGILKELIFLTNSVNYHGEWDKEAKEWFETVTIPEIERITKPYGSLTFLGSGADGIAFQLASDKIFKIFRSEYAYKSALEAMTSLHINDEFADTEPMFYEVDVLDDFGNSGAPPLYYYIQEKLKTNLTWAENSVITTILHFIRYHYMKYINAIRNNMISGNQNKAFEQINMLTNKISNDYKAKLAKMDTTNIKIFESMNRMNKNWVEKFIKEVIMKSISDRPDLHTGNLGITNTGNIRYFDPAYGENVTGRAHIAF